MNITGLESDLYFSDNPIYLEFENINPNVNYIQISITGLIQQGNTGKPLRLYPTGSSLTYDISQFVKAQFREVTNQTDYTQVTPQVINNNWIYLNLTFKEVLKDDTSTTTNIPRTFVKGGLRRQGSNFHTQINTLLSPIGIIPFWGGYPISYNYFNESKQMVMDTQIPIDIREARKKKGCEPLYIKFRNSRGGYSYWLFEQWENKYRNIPLGETTKKNSFYDLGNEESIQIEAESKVPKRFTLLLVDLIVSSEVYIYNGLNDWERVKNVSNNITQNPYNQNEKIKVKFERVLKYNPSELW